MTEGDYDPIAAVRMRDRQIWEQKPVNLRNMALGVLRDLRETNASNVSLSPELMETILVYSGLGFQKPTKLLLPGNSAVKPDHCMLITTFKGENSTVPVSVKYYSPQKGRFHKPEAVPESLVVKGKRDATNEINLLKNPSKLFSSAFSNILREADNAVLHNGVPPLMLAGMEFKPDGVYVNLVAANKPAQAGSR